MKPHQRFLAAQRAKRKAKPSAPLLTEGEVWLAAWLAVANASNSTSTARTTEWADRCVDGYATRFNTKGRLV